MERLRSGNEGLDRILGGGFRPGSLVVIGGAPGTGKTILAQQICFANAKSDGGGKAIYYTTLSEPHSKLVRHLEDLAFFDPDAVGDRVIINHLAAVTPGAHTPIANVIDELVRVAFEQRPAIIVIDSSRALHEMNPDGFREAIFDLAGKIALTDAVLILVGEYGPEDVKTAPEFAVADAIILLTNDPMGQFDRRLLRVMKMRGSGYLGGHHTFAIGAEGFTVFVRPESEPLKDAAASERRVLSGVAGLDEMTTGGLPQRSVTLVAGPSGAGKTVLGLQFLNEGLRNGEQCLYASFLESEAQLLEKAAAFGWDFTAARDKGLLTVCHLQPVELGLDQVAHRVLAALDGCRATRVVIDSMAELQHAAIGTNRFADYLWTLLGRLRTAGATTILTSETAAFFGPTFELARGLSFVADNVVLLRYTELESEIRRALSVIKMRDSDHVKTLVEFEIGKAGMTVKGRFVGLAGVLTGTPVRVEEKFKEFFGRS